MQIEGTLKQLWVAWRLLGNPEKSGQWTMKEDRISGTCKDVSEIKFEIKGNPRPKKNNIRPIKTKDGRVMLIQSQGYLDYESEAIPQLEKVKQKIKKPFSQPLNLKCIYYRGDRRRCDLLNLLNATADILVKAKILEDDNYKIVVSTDGSRVYYDKENPRVEIEIEELKEEDK